MKNQNKLAVLILFAFFIVSCSSNKEKAPEATEQTPPATSDLMKEDPAYDATKIDPNAKVVDITLKTVGNTMTDMKFDQSEIRVPAGSTVKITLVNEATDAAMIHNFLLVTEGSMEAVATEALKAGQDMSYVPSMKEVLTASKLVQPKETTEFTFPAPEKGVYDFVCTYPGHYKMMNGKFIVE